MTQRNDPAPKGVLDEFRRRLTEHFGQRLVGLILFGSGYGARQTTIAISLPNE